MDQIRLGVDVGGVIIDRIRNDGTDTSFLGENFLATTAVPDSFEVLKELVEKFRSENVFIVSKCGEKVRAKTLHWMSHHKFFERTGISMHNVLFCYKRHEKAAICKRLEINHFIDDRLEVLSHLEGIVPNRFLFLGNVDEALPFKEYLPQVTQVNSWQEVREALLL